MSRNPKPAAKTREKAAEARRLLESGYSDKETVNHLQINLGVSRRQAYRYVRLAHREQTTRTNRRRGMMLARQSAKLDRAQKEAMARVRAIHTKTGELVAEIDDPDLAAFVAAVREQNKLLDLYDAKTLELVEKTLRPVLATLRMVITKRIADPKLRDLIFDDIRSIAINSVGIDDELAEARRRLSAESEVIVQERTPIGESGHQKGAP